MVSQSAIVYTWGCSHNQKDSQIVEQILIDEGYNLKSDSDENDADVIIFNTCTVKTPTENKIMYKLNQYKNSDKKVIVIGCLSQANPNFIQQKFPNFIIMGVNAAKHLQIVLGNGITLPLVDLGRKDKKNKAMIEKDWIVKPNLESTRWNENVNIVQINEGCVNSCTFCATKFARGKLRSYSKDSIIGAIRKVITPEVWLTSQDTACWGFDINDNLPSLVEEIDLINRKFLTRIGMGNPNNVIKIIDKLIDVYKSPKIYKFLHLPLQSGSNSVLKHMKRGYTVEEFELIVKKFRQEIPDITISTDVICGYPTESEIEFEETINVIKKTRPEICNISRYWERKGTEAAGLPQLSHIERKRRSSKLSKLVKDIIFEDNKKWLDWEGEILINEIGTKGGFQGRNLYYKPVIIHDNNLKLGSWVKVKIIDYFETYLLGETI